MNTKVNEPRVAVIKQHAPHTAAAPVLNNATVCARDVPVSVSFGGKRPVLCDVGTEDQDSTARSAA